MNTAYKFRIYPSRKQEVLIHKTFGCSRFVYNYFLDLRKTTYSNSHMSLRYTACCRNLTQLKKQNDFSWLNEVDITALRSSLRFLDNDFEKYFKSYGSATPQPFPQLKTKRSSKQSYTTTSNIRVYDNYVHIPKLGLVKCAVSRQIQGRVLNATISQLPSGEYFVSVCCEVQHQPLPKTNKQVGIDVGVKMLATLSDGTKYENHKYLHKSEKRIQQLQRKLSRKSKGSKRYEKARLAVAKLHRHIANQRLDTIHKVTTSIVKEFDLICVEDLAVSDIIRTNHFRAFHKAVADTGMGTFLSLIRYKSDYYGKKVISVGSDFPSSQICSCCGSQNYELRNYSISRWACPKCGTTHDRDINAAKNILNEGLRLLTA